MKERGSLNPMWRTRLEERGISPHVEGKKRKLIVPMEPRLAPQKCVPEERHRGPQEAGTWAERSGLAKMLKLHHIPDEAETRTRSKCLGPEGAAGQ